MKQLLKKIKQISILLLVISFTGCTNEDDFLPKVEAGYTYTVEGAKVTFINTSENSTKYLWNFADETTSTEINPTKVYTTSGVYKVKLKASNVAGASDTFESDVTVTVPDVAVPVITLIGEATITLMVGDTFTDPGATAADDIDGDISANIVVGGDTVDTSTAGTYTITYNVTDSSGNEAAEVTRTVVVNATVDPVVALPIDFELGASAYNITDFDGGMLTVEDNPFATGINTTTKVGKMVKNEGQVWGGSAILLNDPIDFSTKKTFKVKVYSPRVGVGVLLKVENADDNSLNHEKTATTTVANQWEELTFDYSDINTANSYHKVIFIFDNGTVGDGSDNYTFYIDDVELVETTTPAPDPVSVITNFENNLMGVTPVGFESSGMLVSNPDSEGNTSANVYKISYSNNNQWWGGVGFKYEDNVLDDQATMYKVKVYSTVAQINVLFELEVDGGTPVGDIKEITTANEWVELTFTLSNVPSGANRIIIRPDVGDKTGTKPNSGDLYVDDFSCVSCDLGDGGSGGGGTGTCEAPSGGEFISDGGFEQNAGCWELIDNGGTVTVSTTVSKDGNNSGQIKTVQFKNPALKQTRFGAGTIEPNTTYLLTFDYKADTTDMPAEGAVFQVAAFSEAAEGSGGSATRHEILAGDATFPTTWNSRSYTFTTAANVEGGLSLLLELVCGGADQCTGTVNIDNVSLTKQ